MSSSVYSRIGKLVLFLMLMPAMLHAAASVNVYKVEVNNSEVDDLDEIYANEDATIKLYFSYASDSSTTVNGWEIWVNQVDSGDEYAEGDFSGDTATVSFTTKDVVQKTSTNYIPSIGTKKNYSYKLVVKIDHSESSSTTTTDGDDDDETSTETETVNDEPTQSIEINIDMDPPETVKLSEEIQSGEESLKVSWEEITQSETGADEKSVKVKFCLIETSETSSTTSSIVSVFPPVFLDADGDTEAAEDDTETTIVDGDAEISDTPQEQDLDEAEVSDIIEENPAIEDGDEVDEEKETATTDGDATEEESDDGSSADGDVDSTETSEVSETDIAGCVIHSEDGVSGTSHTITGLKNDTLYEIRAKGIDLAGNESTNWSDPVYGSPKQVDDFWESYKKQAEKEKGGFCFIATAAYGSYSANEVLVLRLFRDKVLSKFTFGRWFIGTYYKYSPPAAKWIEQNPVAAKAVQWGLYPVVLILEFAFFVNSWLQISILSMMVLALFVYYRRVKRVKEVV